MGLAAWQGSGGWRDGRGGKVECLYVPVQRHRYLLPLWFMLEIIHTAEVVVWPWFGHETRLWELNYILVASTVTSGGSWAPLGSWLAPPPLERS
jgi:hypothetical protein